MDITLLLSEYVDSWKEYLIPMIFIHFFIILLLWRMFINARIYLGTKKYVAKTNKLRRKKYNGLLLNDYTKKKRKRKTNTFKGLRTKAKSKVEAYLKYKEEELIGITNYSYGKLLKRNKENLCIYVSNGKKKIQKIYLKKSLKQFIDLMDTYECLDEFIQYLHNLPEAILNREDYDDSKIIIRYGDIDPRERDYEEIKEKLSNLVKVSLLKESSS